MKALIITFGSTGDVYPMIGLAKALQHAGHEACIATSNIFAQEIENEKIPFHPLPPEWTFDDFKQFTETLCSTNNKLKQFGLIYDGFGPFIDDIAANIANKLQDFDVLISTYLFPFFKIVAEQQQKPFVTVAFSHNIIPRWDRPPENTIALTWLPAICQKQWNLFWWRCADIILSGRIKKSLKTFSQSIRIDSIGSFVFDPSEHVLVASSQALMEQAVPMDARFHIIGYLRHQSHKDASATKQLNTFCQGESVPIITFGSMAALDAQKKLDRLLTTWPQDKKLIVQAGWADLKIPAQNTPNLLRLKKLSHDQLFQYASVVVHHGGAGTTASVLHAGKPHIIIPHLGDQYFWADEITTHGLGIKLNYRSWPKKLHHIIKQVEQNNHYQQQATIIAQKLQQENGADNAVKLLEEIVE